MARPQMDIACDPEFAAAPDDPLSEAIVVAQFWKSRRRDECVRVTLSRYQGKPILDVRIYFTTASGFMQPSKKGIAFSIDKLPDLRKALEKAEARAITLDLLEAVS